MTRRLVALGVAVSFGLLLSPACTLKDPNANDGVAGVAIDAGGTGNGSAGRASGTAGRGGSGSAGAQAGAPSKAGSGDVGGGGADDGGAGGAPSSAQCPSCESGFCFKDGTCVDCLPSEDNCASGKVCGSTNTCVPGCKADGTSCTSGVCADTKNCERCIGDTECGNGNVCGDGHCAAKCTAEQEGTSNGCGPGLTCCSLHCIDDGTDSDHCGACGNSCAAGQFCGAAACDGAGAGGEGGQGSRGCVACQDTTLANLCSIPRIAVVLDGQVGNETPGRAIAAAIAAQCPAAPELREVLQTVPDALNPASGRPVAGAHELLVAAGGSFYARLLVYLDTQKLTHLYWYYDQQHTVEFRKSATDEAVIARDTAEPYDNHDFFVIQFMRDPSTGSLILNAEGFWLSGTVAAAYFFEHGMLPNLSQFDKSWYVYEWTDKDGDLAPDSNEMEQIAAGN